MPQQRDEVTLNFNFRNFVTSRCCRHGFIGIIDSCHSEGTPPSHGGGDWAPQYSGRFSRRQVRL